MTLFTRHSERRDIIESYPAVSPERARRIALVAGVLFLITYITSIPAPWRFQPVLDDPAGYIAGAGPDTRIFLGAFLELLLIIANIGTAVVLYPILRRQSEILALGYVTARVMECVFIAVGILSVLAVVSLRQDAANADSGSVAFVLAAIKDWTFLLGPGFVVGIGNGMLLGYLMYQSARATAHGHARARRRSVDASRDRLMFDVDQPGGTLQSIATIPEFFWELSLGLWLTFKGFLPSPVLSARGAGDSSPDRRGRHVNRRNLRDALLTLLGVISLVNWAFGDGHLLIAVLGAVALALVARQRWQLRGAPSA